MSRANDLVTRPRTAARGTALLAPGLLAPGLLALALTGCSGGSGPADPAGSSPAASVARSTLVTQIGSQLQAKKVKTDPDSLTCPAGLPARTGQTITCHYTTDSQPVDAVATVTAVQGNSVSFDVTTRARPVAKDVLVQKVDDELSDEAKAAVDDVSCAGDLPAQVGGSTTCTATVGGIKGSFRVSVLAINGGQISYSIDNG